MDITEEDILRERLCNRQYREYELGSAEYWKQKGWNEAMEEAQQIVENYLKKKEQ